MMGRLSEECRGYRIGCALRALQHFLSAFAGAFRLWAGAAGIQPKAESESQRCGATQISREAAVLSHVVPSRASSRRPWLVCLLLASVACQPTAGPPIRYPGGNLEGMQLPEDERVERGTVLELSLRDGETLRGSYRGVAKSSHGLVFLIDPAGGNRRWSKSHPIPPTWLRVHAGDITRVAFVDQGGSISVFLLLTLLVAAGAALIGTARSFTLAP